MWGLAVNERSRALLLDLGVVQVLVQVAQQSLELPCVAHLDHQEAYLAGGKITQAQRNQLQVRALPAHMLQQQQQLLCTCDMLQQQL